MSRAAALIVCLALSACTHFQSHPHTLGPCNSLGMAFHPLHDDGHGHRLEMCIHETRERDMAAFRSGYSAHSDHAVTQVTWHDARAFCAWLTTKERADGSITAHSLYRLPTDHEWSMAAQIADREDAHATPESKDNKVANCYPWGNAWQPPSGFANYLGTEAINIIDSPPINGFHDQDKRVGSALHYFAPRLGYCSLGGNVWEWCTDEFRPGTDWRVLRGGSWKNNRTDTLQLSHRTHDPSTYKSDTVGFRVLLERNP